MKKSDKKLIKVNEIDKQKSAYSQLNIMQRHDMVSGFAKDVINKLGKETVTKQREAELIQKGINEGVNAALCVMIDILWNHYGEIRGRADRLQKAFNLFTEGLAKIETPSEKQLEAEAEFTKQTGADITRDKVA